MEIVDQNANVKISNANNLKTIKRLLVHIILVSSYNFEDIELDYDLLLFIPIGQCH